MQLDEFVVQCKALDWDQRCFIQKRLINLGSFTRTDIAIEQEIVSVTVLPWVYHSSAMSCTNYVVFTPRQYVNKWLFRKQIAEQLGYPTQDIVVHSINNCWYHLTDQIAEILQAQSPEVQEYFTSGAWKEDYNKLLVTRQKSAKSSQKSRAQKFTVTEQRGLVGTIVDQFILANPDLQYAMQTLLDHYRIVKPKIQIRSGEEDLTGQKLKDSLTKLFPLDENKVMQTLSASTNETERRFAVMLGDNTEHAGLLDQDARTRLAAQIKRNKKKKEKEKAAITMISVEQDEHRQ